MFPGKLAGEPVIRTAEPAQISGRGEVACVCRQGAAVLGRIAEHEPAARPAPSQRRRRPASRAAGRPGFPRAAVPREPPAPSKSRRRMTFTTPPHGVRPVQSRRARPSSTSTRWDDGGRDGREIDEVSRRARRRDATAIHQDQRRVLRRARGGSGPVAKVELVPCALAPVAWVGFRFTAGEHLGQGLKRADEGFPWPVRSKAARSSTLSGEAV